MKNRKLLKVLIVALAVAAAGAAFALIKRSGTQDAQELVYETEEYTQESSGEEDPTETSFDEEICVYVCGAVNSPGVYYLPSGSRVHEAVEMAGGLTDEAAEDYVNMASLLEDGEQLYIPTQEEAEEEGLEIDSASSSSGSDSSSESLININTASSEELQTLSGIGEAKAAAIISYREENGDFESIEDIMNVSGIGESTFENIKDYITV